MFFNSMISWKCKETKSRLFIRFHCCWKSDSRFLQFHPSVQRNVGLAQAGRIFSGLKFHSGLFVHFPNPKVIDEHTSVYLDRWGMIQEVLSMRLRVLLNTHVHNKLTQIGLLSQAHCPNQYRVAWDRWTCKWASEAESGQTLWNLFFGWEGEGCRIDDWWCHLGIVILQMPLKQ